MNRFSPLKINTHHKSVISLAATITLLASQLLFPVISAHAYTNDVYGVDDSVLIKGSISTGVKAGKDKTTLSLRDADIRDVLYMLAQQGGFNLVVHEEVEGTITVDLKNVSIDKTFEYILTLADLTYIKDGDTFIVTTREDGQKKTINRLVLKSLQVKYSNAQDLANALNNTVFSVNRPGGNQQAVATADLRTNSILIVGNAEDIDLAQRTLAELDFPLDHKTYLLKHAPARDVANAIGQTLFGVGLQITQPVGSATGTGGTIGQQSNTGLQNNQNTTGATAVNNNSNNTQGNGGTNNNTGNNTQNGSQNGQGGAQGNGGDPIALSSGVQTFTAGPMTFLINSANNTLTLIGTAEQIRQAEDLLYDLDIRPPQVAIEVALVQLSENKKKSFSFGVNTTDGISLNNKTAQLLSTASTAITWGGGFTPAVLSNIQLNSKLSYTTGKILANPTVVAVSGSNSKINITEQVFAGVSSTVSGTSGQITTTPILQDVGLTLDITPRVTNDGTININIQPTVKSIKGSITYQDQGQPQSLTLTTDSTLNIANARVKNGSTLILGGLIRENSTGDIANKTPFLGDLPIIGSLFRNGQTNNQDRTELVIFVTPHILKEEGVPFFREEWKQMSSYPEVSYQGPYSQPTRLPSLPYNPGNSGSPYNTASPRYTLPNNYAGRPILK